MSVIRLTAWLAIIFAVLLPLFLFFNLAEKRGLIRNPAEEGDIEIEIIAKNLDVPWSMDFLPDGRMIFTERSGRVKILDLERGQIKEAGEIAVTQISESGLLGIAVDPDFSENNYVYFYYTYENNGMKNRVSRFILSVDRLSTEEIILDNIPGSEIHDGGRIKFGPDGLLYITTGDARNPELSQDVNSLAGKILRIKKDGSVPEDNPFPNNPVYSYGHRNVQGIAWHTVTNNLYATEHGPSQNDELNFIEAGKNYGWPATCSETGEQGIEHSLICFADETIAPGGAAFYAGEGEWKNNLFFTSLRGTHLHRVIFTGSKNIDRNEKILSSYGRLRDVVYHDGYLYIATSNRDGRGFPVEDDDKILRIKPV